MFLAVKVDLLLSRRISCIDPELDSLSLPTAFELSSIVLGH